MSIKKAKKEEIAIEILRGASIASLSRKHGISRQAIYRWVRNGELDYFLITKRFIRIKTKLAFIRNVVSVLATGDDNEKLFISHVDSAIEEIRKLEVEL